MLILGGAGLKCASTGGGGLKWQNLSIYTLWVTPVFILFSECPTLCSSMFCSRCSTWKCIYIHSWEHLSMKSKEFRLGNSVIQNRVFKLDTWL